MFLSDKTIMVVSRYSNQGERYIAVTSPYYDTLRRMNLEKEIKELLKKWKELPEPKPTWESFKRRSQFQKD